MGNVSFAIMAHDRRQLMVEELSAQLDHPHEIEWDRGISRWETGHRAWSCYDREAEWHVVLQDDAIICENFVSRVTEFLDATKPDRPVSFYLGNGRPRQNSVLRALEDVEGDRLQLRWLLWGVCIAIPTSHIDDILFRQAKGIPNYDSRISQYYERRRVPVVYSWPSLVDHRDEPSLVYDNLTTPRVAHWFIDDEKPKHIKSSTRTHKKFNEST